MEIINSIIDLLFGGGGVIRDGVFVPVTKSIAIVPIIAAAISALAAGGSAIAGANANKKNQKILNDQNRENEQMYLQEYYRGALENEGSRAYLKRLDQAMEKRNKAAENSAVASGATHENALAAKQANNEVMSDAIAGLIEKEDARKMQVQDRYFGNRNAIRSNQMNQNAAVANNWAGIGSGITSAAGSLASAYLMSGNYGINPNAAAPVNTAATDNTNPAKTLVP